MNRLFVFLFSAMFLLDALVNGVSWGMTADPVMAALKKEIEKKYPGTQAEITAPVRWLSGLEPVEVSSLSITTESLRGELRFAVADQASIISEGLTTFAANVPAWVAVRRVHPGEKITAEMFVARNIDVAHGAARDYRGVIQTPKTLSEVQLGGLEARQTILEGQFLISSAVQRTPDVRRGDVVTIHVLSNGVALSTGGVAQEAAYLNGPVRVLTTKSKRELTGSLKGTGLVEVKL